MNGTNTADQRKERFLQLIARQAADELDRLWEIPDTPTSMAYFYDVLEKTFIRNSPVNAVRSADADKPVIGTYCIFVPEELIYAAGAIPVRLCAGCFDAAKISEDFLPRDCCPLVKSSMGLMLQNGLELFDRCDAVIIPTTCDSKRKLGEELSALKQVWMLEVPHIKDAPLSRNLWLEQIRALKTKLEKFATPDGRSCGKIDAKKLGHALSNALRAQREMRRLLDIRKLERPVIWGRQTTAAINAYAYAPVEDWAVNLRRLNDQLSERAFKKEGVCPEDTPRIFIAGSPAVFPNLKVVDLVEAMGGVVVIDESCAGDRYLYDPVGDTERNLEDQITALASRYLAPCLCPSFAPNDDRLILLRRLLRDHAVDGVLYHVLKGCIIYDFEVARVGNMLKACGIPMIRVETDYNPEDVEQLRTRIEAFIEMIKSRGKPKNGAERRK